MNTKGAKSIIKHRKGAAHVHWMYTRNTLATKNKNYKDRQSLS